MSTNSSQTLKFVRALDHALQNPGDPASIKALCEAYRIVYVMPGFEYWLHSVNRDKDLAIYKGTFKEKEKTSIAYAVVSPLEVKAGGLIEGSEKITVPGRSDCFELAHLLDYALAGWVRIDSEDAAGILTLKYNKHDPFKAMISGEWGWCHIQDGDYWLDAVSAWLKNPTVQELVKSQSEAANKSGIQKNQTRKRKRGSHIEIINPIPSHVIVGKNLNRESLADELGIDGHTLDDIAGKYFIKSGEQILGCTTTAGWGHWFVRDEHKAKFERPNTEGVGRPRKKSK